MIRVSILGATGYSGGELLKYLLNDPDLTISHITSESSSGMSVALAHPWLRGRLNLQFEALNVKKIAADSDVVFSCYPAGVGMKPIAYFIKAGLKVIDLSADYRLSSASLYKNWYKITHTETKLLSKAVYGLPELFRSQISHASLVANPGCYATAAALAAAPLLEAGIVHPDGLIVDAKSGVSGAGKKVAFTYLYNEVDENLTAYNVASHRHQPEIEQTLSRVRKGPVRLTFTPHLIPMKRGILSVLYATLKKPMKTSKLVSLFEGRYHGEPFIRVLPEGELPQTKNVTNTNYCDIGIAQDARMSRVIVFSALDNLVKGAAGQAIQNMNLLLNREETRGLL